MNLEKSKYFIILNGEIRSLLLWSYLIGSSIDYVQKDRISLTNLFFIYSCNFKTFAAIFFILGKLPAHCCLVTDGDCVQACVPCCLLLSCLAFVARG